MNMDSKYSSYESMQNNGLLKGNNNTTIQSHFNGFQIKRKQTPNSDINNLQQLNKVQKTSNETPGGNSYTSSSNNDSGNMNGDVNNKFCANYRSISEQRKQLPIFGIRDRVIQEVIGNPTLIIIGETGCGKTTQIPQYLHECNLSNIGEIAVTQPRRVAAITIAKRVAQEVGCRLGEVVGYTVRFDDKSSKQTKIKYMTDGSLLREALSDRLLVKYRVIILDEAHERTINTDVLFGIIKEAQKTRHEKKIMPLKIIIMSATMDVDHFANYFNNCNIVYLDGRLFPIKVMNTKFVQPDYVSACISTFFQIHTQAPPDHDVLIFLTGQDEIEAMASEIRKIAKSNQVEGPIIRVFPLYSQLPQHKQLEVFHQLTPGSRKVILATNIAETSLTINGIRYVIDSGHVKRRVHDAITGLDTLKIVKISQAQAWQRAGRAGRDSDGFCYRTYTLAEYNSMQPNTTPEIQRSNISATVLQLLALEIDCQKFDFMDPPSKNSIEFALKTLNLLGAISTTKSLELTPLGKRMAKFPLDPRFSKMILAAANYNCVEDMLSLIAVLSGENIFSIPNEKQELAMAAHAKFQSKYGDHLTLLNVFKAFEKTEKAKLWCHDNFLNQRNLTYARDVRAQLLEICQTCNIPCSSCGTDTDQIRKCLITGLFNNIAELQRDRWYITLTTRQRAQIHPSSVFERKGLPEYLVFTEIVQSNKTYLRYNTSIEPEWIDEVLPNSDIKNRRNKNRINSDNGQCSRILPS